MPKLTAKYKAAVEAARPFNARSDDAEALYTTLQDHGYQWDSDEQEWVNLADAPADEPTPLIMVRVWSDAEICEESADLVEDKFKRSGYTLVERSKPYLCRPPKQLEARVYLKFMPKGKNK